MVLVVNLSRYVVVSVAWAVAEVGIECANGVVCDVAVVRIDKVLYELLVVRVEEILAGEFPEIVDDKAGVLVVRLGGCPRVLEDVTTVALAKFIAILIIFNDHRATSAS